MRFVFLFPRFKLLSGAERLILRLSAHVARQGHQVTILCHQMHASCRPPAAIPGLEIIETGRRLDRFRNRYMNAPFDYLSSLSLLRFVSDPEAVCVFFGPALPACAWHRGVRRRKNRCLYFCYEPPRFIYRDRADILRKTGAAALVMAPGFLLYRWLDRCFVSVPDEILTQGEFGRAEIERVYDRMAVIIPHGSDMSCMERSPGGPFTALSVNYLHPRKRIDLLLRALGRMKESGSQVRAVVVGDGPEKEQLGRLAGELGIAESVRFTGFVEDAELPGEFVRADVYVHTGRLESFGLSVLDALATGLPVVSVDEGGPAEMISDGRTGFLVPARADAVAEKVLMLERDPELRRRMGRAAAESVRERYRWELGAEALIRVARIS